MQYQLILVLLAAVASARPVPANNVVDQAQGSSRGIETREVEYSKIKDLYTAREEGTHHSVAPREVQYSDIVALYAELDAEQDAEQDRLDHHRGHRSGGPYHGDGLGRHHDAEHRPHDHPEAFKHHAPHDHHEEFDHFEHGPHHHHQHNAPHDHIVDNIVGFLTHQMRRSVPEASARVVNGILAFFAGETRDVHEQHHPRQYEPRHLHPHAPGPEVERHILDFFASHAR